MSLTMDARIAATEFDGLADRRRLAKRYLRCIRVDIQDEIKFDLERLLELAIEHGYIERHTGMVVPETDREDETNYILMEGV